VKTQSNLLSSEQNPKTKEVNVTRIFDWLQDSKARINILRGGTGSSKSYSMAQHFVINKLCGQSGKVLVVARKTLPALKKTAYKLILDLVSEYDIPHKLNKTDLELRVNDNILYFLSLDDPEKIKSLNTDDVWLEEANEFTLEDFTQFNLRMSGQMYLSFNPVSSLHWIKTELIDKGFPDLAEDVSTYRDNPFLPEVRVRQIENLIEQDKNRYRIYAKGEWGILEDLIYTDFKVYSEKEFEKLKDRIEDISFGIDFGFTNPAAIVKIYWIDGKFIAEQILYQNRLTNTQFIEKAKSLISEQDRMCEFYADPSEPDRIQEFFSEGFNIHKAKKDVRAGIDFCKSHLLGFTANSEEAIKEAQGYGYKKDKDGRTLEEPVKFNDHAMDAMRYGAYSPAQRYGTFNQWEEGFR